MRKLKGIKVNFNVFFSIVLQYSADTKGDVEVSSIQFDLQKTKSEDSETSSAAELATASTAVPRETISGTRERRESESGARERRESESETRERRESGSGTRERRESGSGTRERHGSGNYQDSSQPRLGHARRPSDGNVTGIPQLVRDPGQQPKSILSQKSSISDTSDRVTSPIPPPSRNASARFDLASPEIESKKSVSTSTSASSSTRFVLQSKTHGHIYMVV